MSRRVLTLPHAIDARRRSTARTCRRRHFHRRGNPHQCRGATGAPSTRSRAPTCTMEAQLRARIDLAILARDRVGCARYAGLFWQLGLALAAWSGADPRQLALHARGSSGQQGLEAAPPGAANVETRDLVENWGKLHAVRSALGLGATLVHLLATLQA